MYVPPSPPCLLPCSPITSPDLNNHLDKYEKDGFFKKSCSGRCFLGITIKLSSNFKSL